MTPRGLSRRVPDASPHALRLLDLARGPVESPIRSEIFGPDRFAQHGRSLGDTHRADHSKARRAAFFPRLSDNIRVLREAQNYIGAQAKTGYNLSPAAEWLLDNVHLIESQLKEIKDGLPRRYFRDLPVLIEPPLAGLPRVYGVAWAFVAHTDGAFDEVLLTRFLTAYQETRELTLGELWALPTTLRVVLVENLRRLAERIAVNNAARELANLVCDRVAGLDEPALDDIQAQLQPRGATTAFLVQMAQRLRDYHPVAGSFDPLAWLGRALPDLPSAQMQQLGDQAADNLSVSNAIGSLRLIGNADWQQIVTTTSGTLQRLLASAAFAAEREDTRDISLHEIERLARRSCRSESEVAGTLTDLMQGQAGGETAASAEGAASAGHWLHGPGRPQLTRRLGFSEQRLRTWRNLRHRAALPAYLGALALATAGLVDWMLARHSAALPSADAPLWLTLLTGALMLFPASEAVVAVINRLISESARPTRLPRLALAHGIPADHRVMVVIPGMLTGTGDVQELAHRLELHHLANPERQVQFALLTDWADAPTEALPGDAGLLEQARLALEQLNRRHPAAVDDGERFILLHRRRRFSTTEQCWIGWERKRGKLEQLLALLADPAAAGAEGGFIELGALSRPWPQIRYLLTLDGDTGLPPGRLRDLVGIAAHPQNQPVIDPVTRSVVAGYGILQPRIATPLPRLSEVTLYHRLFAGQCGIDPYSAASSEVYQDVFGEGTYTGKGLIHVQAAHAVLHQRLPEARVLSHDLLEGSLVRCAAVTDVTLTEDAPFHADVAASRVHRWTRGDWQLLPFLLSVSSGPGRGIRAINRWKMVDNLRRSLVAPMSLGLLLLSLASPAVSPWAAFGLVLAAFVAGPLMGAVAGFAPSRDDVAKSHFFRLAGADLARAVCGGAWMMALLLQQALLAGDAVVRAVYRMAVSRRHLLEWTTAAAAQASASTRLGEILRKHRWVPLIAVALLVGLLARGPSSPLLAVALCLAWACAPVWVWWVSRPAAGAGAKASLAALPPSDRAYLQGIARDTWRMFERCVGPADNHLPPDNIQVTPHTLVAHRTSPTNIGLYLLSTACARRLGWIGTEDLLSRMEATVDSLLELPRHRGHFLNWYDTERKAALLPMYVSTVDSGNLCGHLLAVAEACRELRAAPHDDAAARRALAASRALLEPLLVDGPAEALRPDSPIARLLALPEPWAAASNQSVDVGGVEDLLQQARAELDRLLPLRESPLAHTAADRCGWRLRDHLATLDSTWTDRRAVLRTGDGAAPEGPSGSTVDSGSTVERLTRLADTCERLAWEADFAFLYHRKRHLFHIGYRVVEQQLDSSFYDLLASESRLTSLLAIAKGDVPVAHWAALGRPFFAVGSLAGLRSWSGSMFEYLMPSLVLDEPVGSVLDDANRAALVEQVRFADIHGVPWGISESAYAGSDHTLAYQYAPQGVPRLAIRRTPPQELVVAPYSTALGALVQPAAAVANLRRMEHQLQARGQYGFIEALDFTPPRQSAEEGVTRVHTFMAHHQGMTIVAIANLLEDGVARRWAMANAHLEAVAPLLHERAPREVPVLRAPPPGAAPPRLDRRQPGLLREVPPGATAVEPTHLLSNGRYAVALRANGAGWSRWRNVAISRSRDDALRDAYGSFFHLRWDRQPTAVSLTQHPAPDPAAEYRSTYHADRICFDAAWPEIETRVTVWVGPEDDLEFRKVELRNLGDRALDLELMSAFQITLADTRADEAHPAFSNLFLRAHWQSAHQALVFERKPRLATEKGLHAAHFLTDVDAQVSSVRLQTDRAGWLGRNRDVSQPLARFDAAPNDGDIGLLDTGLDPVCALSTRLRLAPGATASLTFCTAAADSGETLASVVDKYRRKGPIDRASLMSTTLTGIRMRELRISAEDFAAIQSLTTALVMNLSRPRLPSAADPDPTRACDRRLLWRFGISGDLPILLVTAGVPQGAGLLRSMAQALRVWSWGGVACDLVVINSEPSSYLMPMQRDLASLRERYIADSNGQPGLVTAGFHLLRGEEVSAEEASTLRTLARLHLNADGRPLVHHLQEWNELHEEAYEARHATFDKAVPVHPGAESGQRTSIGRFTPNGGEFRFEVDAFQRPKKPWVNVLANPDFGTQLSEAGGGYTWALNSRLNMLTPWSNDPLADPPGEWLLLQDLRGRDTWSVTPSAWGDPGSNYRISHGQGHSVISHRRGDVDVSVSWCVEPATAVKQARIRIVNRGHRTQRLRAIGMVEWVMGGSRGDRASADTAHLGQALPATSLARATGPRKLTALFCTQRERSAGFGEGTAFLAMASPADEPPDWTCDRRECFDARGRLALPDELGRASGAGHDPCAVLSQRLTIPAGESAECVFLLGFGVNPAEARRLAAAAATTPPMDRLDQARSAWDELLGATQVRTPDPLFDAMVNRWLLYQTVSCRLWGKAGFYQAGGAFGFRDQLQDAMALAWCAPQLLRRQILLNASRQFAEGDVQHWWHAPTGAGVRTHFSDDLLWLPHACVHYLVVTGDAAVLDEPVHFIEGGPIPEGAEDAYYVPTVGAATATLYEHAALTLDRSLRSGAHGLPLMGTGDWNDGMNRVGHEGRGESVWLAWFLCDVIQGFGPLARARGDGDRADRWQNAAAGWKRALQAEAWDGQWYKRAFFDDGSALGSNADAECRIDLIAQSWAVISGAAPPAFQRMAMTALDTHLVDQKAGLIRLLTPALDQATPSAGYIQAYPKGVRENGGQYSHAGVWAMIAQTLMGQADKAYDYFKYLSPAHRSADPKQVDAYLIEPYVMAGDVYTEAPYVGRGGWSWYTGSAAWMHRAAIEHFFGLQQRGDTLSFRPCLPSSWDRAEITLRRDGRQLRVVFCRAGADCGLSPSDRAAALPMAPDASLHWSQLPERSLRLVTLGEPAVPVASAMVDSV